MWITFKQNNKNNNISSLIVIIVVYIVVYIVVNSCRSAVCIENTILQACK